MTGYWYIKEHVKSHVAELHYSTNAQQFSNTFFARNDQVYVVLLLLLLTTDYFYYPLSSINPTCGAVPTLLGSIFKYPITPHPLKETTPSQPGAGGGD